MELLLLSGWVVSDSLRTHGQQHARPPCPSLSPRVCSNSCPLSWWGHPISSSSFIPFSSCLNLSQHQGVFQWVSISPSNEYLGLICFRIDWFDLFAVQGTLKCLIQRHNCKASVLQCSAFFVIIIRIILNQAYIYSTN